MEIEKFLEMMKELEKKKKGKKEDHEKLKKFFERFHLLNRKYLDKETFEKAQDSVPSIGEAVANTMRLLNLPKYIKDSLRGGRINGSQARALLSFQDEEQQKRMFDAILTGGFKSKDIEDAASTARALVGKRKTPHNAKYEGYMKQLAEHLQAPVLIRVAHGTSKTGQVVIRFANEADLRGVVERIIKK